MSSSYCHQQEQKRHRLLAIEQMDVAQMRVLDFKNTYLSNQEQQNEDAYCLELLVEVAIDRTGYFLLCQLVKFTVQLFLCIAVVLDMDIGTATSRSHLFTHIFVERRHHRLARVVLHIVGGAWNGYRRALGRTDAQHIDTHAFLLRLLSGFQSPTLVVLTIGNDDDGLTDTFLLREAMGGHIHSCCYVGALGLNESWLYAAEEHLCRHEIARDGQLHISLAGKDDKTYLVVGEMIDQILDHHLCTVETTGANIFCQHRVTDVEGYDGFNTCPLLVTDLRTHLRTSQHHNEQSQRREQQTELNQRTEA